MSPQPYLHAVAAGLLLGRLAAVLLQSLFETLASYFDKIHPKPPKEEGSSPLPPSAGELQRLIDNVDFRLELLLKDLNKDLRNLLVFICV